MNIPTNLCCQMNFYAYCMTCQAPMCEHHHSVIRSYNGRSMCINCLYPIAVKAIRDAVTKRTLYSQGTCYNALKWVARASNIDVANALINELNLDDELDIMRFHEEPK